MLEGAQTGPAAAEPGEAGMEGLYLQTHLAAVPINPHFLLGARKAPHRTKPRWFWLLCP